MLFKRFISFKNAKLLSNNLCRSHQRQSPSSFLTILFSKLVGEFLQASKFSRNLAWFQQQYKMSNYYPKNETGQTSCTV